LVAAGGLGARVVAAVLIFRTLTYLLPIPLGVAGPVSAPGAGATPAEAYSR